MNRKKKSFQSSNFACYAINGCWLKACEMATINLCKSTLAAAAVYMLSAEPQESD